MSGVPPKEWRFKSGDPRTLAAARRGGAALAMIRKSPARTVVRLGELETVEDAQRWARIAAERVAVGALSGTSGHAIAQLVRLWLEAAEYRKTTATLRDLEVRVAKQAAELDRLRGENQRLRRVAS